MAKSIKDAGPAFPQTSNEVIEIARDVFDNFYDGPSDPQSFNRALAQVFLAGTQAGIEALPSPFEDADAMIAEGEKE